MMYQTVLIENITTENVTEKIKYKTTWKWKNKATNL